MGNFGSKRSKLQGDRSEDSEGKMGEASVGVETSSQSSPVLAEWQSSGVNTVVKEVSDVFSVEDRPRGRRSRFDGRSDVRRRHGFGRRTGIGRNLCYACGDEGHWRRNCPRRRVDEVKIVIVLLSPSTSSQVE